MKCFKEFPSISAALLKAHMSQMAQWKGRPTDSHKHLWITAQKAAKPTRILTALCMCPYSVTANKSVIRLNTFNLVGSLMVLITSISIP